MGALFGICLAGDSTAKQLEGKYASITAAFVRKDIKPIAAILAPDFTFTDTKGNLTTRERVVASYKTQMASTKEISWTRKVLSVSKVAGSYAATVVSRLDATVLDKVGKQHKLHTESTSIDTWGQSSGQWSLHKTVLLKRNVLLDGKPFTAGGPAKRR